MRLLYVTDDGCNFDNEKQAVDHEILYNRLENLSNRHDWSNQTKVDLIENWDDFLLSMDLMEKNTDTLFNLVKPYIGDRLENGNKIQAIKLLRNITGMGLKDSKEYIDKYQKELFKPLKIKK